MAQLHLQRALQRLPIQPQLQIIQGQHPPLPQRQLRLPFDAPPQPLWHIGASLAQSRQQCRAIGHIYTQAPLEKPVQITRAIVIDARAGGAECRLKRHRLACDPIGKMRHLPLDHQGLAIGGCGKAHLGRPRRIGPQHQKIDFIIGQPGARPRIIKTQRAARDHRAIQA